MLYRIVLGMHAYGMCIALLMFVVSELLLVPARHGRVGSAKAAFHVSRLASVLTTVGVLAGITLFFLGGWPLTPWLVASLLLIAPLMLVEREMVGSWQQRARSLLSGPASDADVRVLARDGRALLGRLLVVGIFGLIIALMVTKPSPTFGTFLSQQTTCPATGADGGNA